MNLLDAIRPETLRDDHRICCHIWSGGAMVSLTYDELHRGNDAYAAAFRAADVARGDVVLIALPHGPALLQAFFGAMLAGCVPAILPPPTTKQDPALYWSSHRRLFERIGSGAMLTWRDNAEGVRRCLQDLPITVLVAEDLGATDATDPPLLQRAADDIAFLQHSSGTTGLKKGVALSFAAVDRQIDAYAASIALDADDCIVSWLPLYHDMGLIACLVLPFVRRVPFVWLDPFEWVARPASLFEAVATHRGTLVWLPNFAFHHLVRTAADTARVDLSSVRAFINCSEPCKAETFDLFVQRFAPWGVRPDQLQVCYAMAEAVFAVTQTPIGGIPRRLEMSGRLLLSVGVPLPDWHVRIVDSEGRAVEDGSIGQVALAGGSLFSGYHRLREETARKFRDGWYLTGDLGFRQDEHLYITGRIDDLLIVHGKNVYAHDVEFVVNHVPGVKPGRTVALGLFVPAAGTQELLLIVETLEPSERRAALARAVKAAVAQHIGLVPRTVHVVEPNWLVKTTSGKISRIENLRKYNASQQALAS